MGLTKPSVKKLADKFWQTRPTPGRESFSVWENMVKATGQHAIPLVWEVMFYNACNTGQWDESLNGVID